MKSPADGDRIDLGGKLPQFDAFAEFAYRELNAGKLIWIRVADPNALTLDDIQYATSTTIHAYQVKWSNQEKPEPLSYTDLKELLPELISGWRKLKIEYASENKFLLVHLLTNRPPSQHDSVKDNASVKAGNFKEFMQQVWNKFKLGEPIDFKWKNVSDEFLALIGMTGTELTDFIAGCDLDINFSPDGFGIGKNINKKRNDDLLKFSRFLFEEVVSKDKKVLFPVADIIDRLEWNSRFSTLFNHELIVDPARYRPITKTMEDLDKIIGAAKRGYVFLSGGPGSGKSSLLTQWAKTKHDYRIIRYYAYDFNDPASMFNSSKRGEASSLFYDLVFQLKEQNICREDTLMQDDIHEIRKIFDRQLLQLSKMFKETGEQTIFIIDGLDHIPREYHGVMQSFLSELPPPAALPEGITIILGSQSFELEGLQADVKQIWKKNDSNVEMASLPREEVYRYIDESDLTITIEEGQKQKLFEISQGHPLYLSYLVYRIRETGDLEFLQEEYPLDGDIEKFYYKCWAPIEKDAHLVNFLGLVSRINGDINIHFIREWDFDDAIKKAFNIKTSFLFQKSHEGWHFFHNSFRQFLIRQSALSPLDDTFDNERDAGFHRQLADYYESSKTEARWNKLRHLYMAGDYVKFVEHASPEIFTEQFLAFRPDDEIESDIQLGLRIARQQHDPYLVIRYLFAFNELESRKRYTTSSSFIEQFLDIGKPGIAKQLVRNNNKVLVNTDFALQVCQWLFDRNEQEDAKMLFSLAEPDGVSAFGIKIPPVGHNRDVFKTMRRWASAAALFIPLDVLLEKINNIEYKFPGAEGVDQETLDNIRSTMLLKIGKVLLKQGKTDELEIVLSQFKERSHYYKTAFLQAVAVRYFEKNDAVTAAIWLQRYKEELAKEIIDEDTQLHVAHMTFKITGDLSATKSLIEGIKQPDVLDDRKIHEDMKLMNYSKRILLNKLLNLTGQGQAITSAVPDSSDPDQKIFIDFERKLCMMAQLSADGLLGNPLPDNLGGRIRPVLRYYYQKEFTTPFIRHSYKWHKLTAISEDYFKYLINSVAAYGKQAIEPLAQLFLEEFTADPAYWSSELQRTILLEFYRYGSHKGSLVKHMKHLETFMFDGKDISGRTDEAFAHAKGWVELDEPALAENWIRATLQQTLGIGYRKDSQFNSWIEWLQTYLKVDATHAFKLFSSFASYLPHIKETTELSTSHDACRALLKATFEHNSSWGFQLMVWSLKTGLIDFESALAICLKDQTIKAGNRNDFQLALNVYGEFYLYIAKSFREDLLRQILKKGFELTGFAFLENDLPSLVHEISVNAMQENRSLYAAAIHEFLELQGYDNSKTETLLGFVPEKKKRDTGSNTLSLIKNYKQLSESEVLDTIKNGKDLIRLLKEEDNANSYYSWIKSLEKIKASMTLEDIGAIYALNRVGNRHTELLAALSCYAFELGYKELAEKMAISSLEQSSSSGWNPYYDGGSRIKAFKALQVVDPQKAYDKALETFIEDILQSKYGNDYIDSLESILPVITPAPDINKTWAEIQSYLERLMTNSGPKTQDEVPELKDLPEVNVMPDLLIYLYKYDIKIIKSKIRKLIVSVFHDNTAVKEKVIALSEGDENEQEKFLEVISLYAVNDPAGVRHFSDQLVALTLSENMWIRANARKLLLKYLPDTEIPVPKKKNLPVIYKLALPINNGFVRHTSIPGDQLIADTDNILQLIHPFEKWLDILHEETGIEPGSILHRWGQILNEKYPEKLTAAYEKQIRSILSTAGLDYHFPRPRNTAALLALGHLVAELKDSNAIINPAFLSDIIEYDYCLDAEVKVTKRPSFVSLIQQRRKLYLSDDWVGNISENKRLHETLNTDSDGRHIAGEYSVLKSLDWGTPEETIIMHLTLDGDLEFEDDEIPFGQVYNCTKEEYYQTENLARTPYIIIKNIHSFKNPGLIADWIAFNPVLALHLGWKPSSKGGFAWENDDGEIMAESVYWLDGNRNIKPPHRESEAGEGWYVKISSKALDLLSDLPCPFFSIRRRIIRERNYEGNHEKEMYNQLIDEWEDHGQS